MKSFSNVAPELAAALAARGYNDPTPVQKAIMGEDISGRDILVSAETGSGKTIAFGLAISPDILRDKDKLSGKPKVLIVTPTRELTLQVKQELEWLYAKTFVSVASCVGGMDMKVERRSLKDLPSLVLGTPGRLKDHIERGSLNISELNTVVLDEADEMLNLGFREELEFILGNTPADRRTILFSATISKGIEKLASRYQNKALRISTISKNIQHLDIEYRAFSISPKDNENAIMNALRYYDVDNALVFCGTRANVNHLTSRLNNRGFSVVSMSGELSQSNRIRALQSMREGRARVCVATDVAARGIDLPNLQLVIHADLPKSKESLLHRSGRTGRAGKKGVSLLIVPIRSQKKVHKLLDSANISATWENPPEPKEILEKDNQRILEDPIFAKKSQVENKDLINSLVEKYNAEKLAAALVHKFKEGKYAPDEIIKINESKVDKFKKNNFEKSVWFKLPMGTKKKVQPGWLLPKLLNGGKIDKKDIGSIKVLKKETFIELNAKVLNQFLKSFDKDGQLEPGLFLSMVDYNGDPFNGKANSSKNGNSKQRRLYRRAKERETLNLGDKK